MIAPKAAVAACAAPRQRPLTPNVAVLGWVSMLTAMSSAMIYGLLPVFLVRVLGVSIASVGLIEGMAEAADPELYASADQTALETLTVIKKLSLCPR